MRSLLFASVLLAAPLALAQDQVMLKRTVNEGDTAKYSMIVNTEMGGSPIKFTATVVEKVAKVNGNGSFVVNSEQQDASLEVNGNVTPIPGDVGAAVSTTYEADGTVSELQGEHVTDAAYRLSNIQIVIWPKAAVGTGSKWEADIKGNKDKGTVDVHSNYEIAAKEDVGKHSCFKVSFECKELSGDTPASSKGTLWIDTATGLIVKSDSEWANAPIAGTVISGKVTMEIVE